MHLGAGSTLSAGNFSYTSTRRVVGPTNRVYHITPWDDDGVTDFERRIIAWEEEVKKLQTSPAG